MLLSQVDDVIAQDNASKTESTGITPAMVLNEINRQLEQQGVIVKRGAFVYCQHANLCPSHRPKDCNGYGEVDAAKECIAISIEILFRREKYDC